jgi:hypothetical protein
MPKWSQLLHALRNAHDQPNETGDLTRVRHGHLTRSGWGVSSGRDSARELGSSRLRRQSGIESAVDVPGDTGDECRLWTRQVSHRTGDVLGAAVVTDRGELSHGVGEFP